MSQETVNSLSTLSISILSGKGGVGKTNLALNLAYALYKANHKMLVMDFDVGLANVDVLLGVSPEKNLQDLLKPGVMPADVVAQVEPGGFDFLPAASGVPELLELDEDMRHSVFTKLNTVLGEYDYIIFDLGAGIGKTVLSLASMTRMRILVVTPEPTSLTDGYAVIKVLKNQHNIKDFQVVVNQATNAKEAQTTFDRLHGACKRFSRFGHRLHGRRSHGPQCPRCGAPADSAHQVRPAMPGFPGYLKPGHQNRAPPGRIQVPAQSDVYLKKITHG